MLYTYLPNALQSNVLFVFLGLVALRLAWRRFGGGLSGIPGPALAKCTRLWKLRSVWKGNHHLTEIALHRQYGPLVRIGPRHVSVGDPAAIPVIYGLNKGFTKVCRTSDALLPGLAGTNNVTDGFLPNPMHILEQTTANESLLHYRRAIPPRPEASCCQCVQYDFSPRNGACGQLLHGGVLLAPAGFRGPEQTG